MAIGKKSGGRDFKAGGPGGPGRPKDSPELRVIKKLTQAQVEEVGSLVLSGDINSLKAIVSEKSKASPLKLMMASVAIRAINKGDQNAMNILLDRIVGKVKQGVEISQPKGESFRVAEMSDEDIAAELAHMAAQDAARQGTKP